MDLKRMQTLAGIDMLTEALDAEQVYPIATITRSQIASMLNNAVEQEGVDIPRFATNDARLTNQVCKRFADHMEKWFEGFEDEWMRGGVEGLNKVATGFLREIGHGALREAPKRRAPKAKDENKKK